MKQADFSIAAEPAALPACVAARVWLDARCYFSRDDTRDHCWLWLLRADGKKAGQVVALHLPVALYQRDHLLTELLDCLDHSHPLALNERTIELEPLEEAPIVPVTRWAVSWGQPVWHDIRAFAERLDQAILNTLGYLECDNDFYGSVGNYNLLASAPEPTRTHRLQALTRFAPLVAPLLVDALERVDMFNGHTPCIDASSPYVHDAQTTQVFLAMDAGRDLIGALARYWHISRSMVKNPLLHQVWPVAQGLHILLPLLDAIAAHARPTTMEEIAPYLTQVFFLCNLTHSATDVQRLADLFRQGWNHFWQLHKEAGQRLHQLRDTRDFAQAALAQIDWMPLPRWLDVDKLLLAWLARKGMASLLKASARWHAEPLVDVSPPEAKSELPQQLDAIFCRASWCRNDATELLTRQALIAEGEQMHHCVGSYWETCLFDGTRIVHLQLANGEEATAQYDLDGNLDDPRFSLEELRGDCNDDCSDDMQRFAEQILDDALNADAFKSRRVQVAQAANDLNHTHHRSHQRQMCRLLDRRSRTELRQVLAYGLQQDDWRQAERLLYRGIIAGFQYGAGAELWHKLAADDALQLVREPHNPHDAQAVRIDWQGHKLGYVPRTDNSEIAQLLDSNIPLSAHLDNLRSDRVFNPTNCTIMLMA